MNDAPRDVTRQAELVVMDCLKSWNCPRSLNAMTEKMSTLNASANATERSSNDIKARKEGSKIRVRLMEYLHSITKGTEDMSSLSIPQQLDPRALVATVKVTESEMKWTSEEVRALKKAMKTTRSEANKYARWKEIAVQVGNNKTKKHCYLKYKELKQERATVAAKNGSSRPKNAIINRKDFNDTTLSDFAPDRVRAEGNMIMSEVEMMKKVDISSNQYFMASTLFDKVSASLVVSQQSTEGRSTFEALEIEDCEDMGSHFSLTKTGQVHSIQASSDVKFTFESTMRGLTSSDVSTVQQLLFGSSKKSFSSHWYEQGFVFSTIQDLQYGLIQHQGGPCGVLAVVQGYVLRFLLLEGQNDWKNSGILQLERVLAQALAFILWQSAVASQASKCVVVIKNNARSKQCSFMASLKLHIASSEEQTRQIITAYISQFTDPKGSGLVQFILSVLFTKGVELIYSEMDQLARDTGGQLIGAHDYCTQELVNLLICGYARSNVFDGDQNLGDTNTSDSDALLLCGIPSQPVLGFLSLFEAYGNLVVGSFLKHPRVNIWVVCSESHYSVLFAADPGAVDDRTFDIRPSVDLLYYDGLAFQDKEIHLTVNTLALVDCITTVSHDDLIPPLDLVIRTKWPRATVEWNGTEPLL
ncbi:protein fam188b [Plasmopara halstedii]|uniref:Protein fam188b n=1 Tax=Plasmopara halstedii TaxID=4781 RepID=A0A0P1ARP5_PLAHL|nr:protein fam188b [Plasmopara halstedii]CEG43970.1 protein fam188b [Plasmopara halstedii]|eukprot:XP_024580339.1 protein fam188b [Plasmopara halstedii]